MRSVGRKMHSEDWQQLSREYRDLTDEERSYYQALGRAAHHARKEGLNPFPANSASASSSRRHLQNTAIIRRAPAEEIDPVAKVVTEQCREKRAEKAARATATLEQHSTLRQFHMDHSQRILHRNRLLQSDAWDWWAFPFSQRSDALNCCVSASRLAHSTVLSNINPASQWENLHIGISEADYPKIVNDDVGAPILHRKRLTQCWEAGFCCCGSGLGKMWGRMWPRLKAAIDQDQQLKRGAVEGDLILQWYCPEFLEPIPANLAELGECALTTYIPIMYLRPWRPTFLFLQQQQEDSDDRRLPFRAELDEQGHLQCWP